MAQGCGCHCSCASTICLDLLKHAERGQAARGGGGDTLRTGIKLGVKNELDPKKEVPPMNTSRKDTQG